MLSSLTLIALLGAGPPNFTGVWNVTYTYDDHSTCNIKARQPMRQTWVVSTDAAEALVIVPSPVIGRVAMLGLAETTPPPGWLRLESPMWCEQRMGATVCDRFTVNLLQGSDGGWYGAAMLLSTEPASTLQVATDHQGFATETLGEGKGISPCVAMWSVALQR